MLSDLHHILQEGSPLPNHSRLAVPLDPVVLVPEGEVGALAPAVYSVGGRLYRFEYTEQSPVLGHQSPVTSLQSPVTSLQSPVTSHQSQVTSHKSQVTSQ